MARARRASLSRRRRGPGPGPAECTDQGPAEDERRAPRRSRRPGPAPASRTGSGWGPAVRAGRRRRARSQPGTKPPETVPPATTTERARIGTSYPGRCAPPGRRSTRDTRPEQLLPHPGHRPGVPTMVLLEGVSRRYQVGDSEVYALRDVDLEVDQGEFAVVLGPSGSGKSTLLNMIGALDSADRRAGPSSPARRSPGWSSADLFRFRREVVSFIFQTFNLFPTLTALENVQCGGEIAGSATGGPPAGDGGARPGRAGRPARTTTRASCRAASSSAWPSPGPWPPGNPIARGRRAHRRPRLPHRGADPRAVASSRPRPAARVIVVTHNREISRVADRVIELSSGRIVSDGPPAGRPGRRSASCAGRARCDRLLRAPVGGRGTCGGGGPRWWSSP